MAKHEKLNMEAEKKPVSCSIMLCHLLSFIYFVLIYSVVNLLYFHLTCYSFLFNKLSNIYILILYDTNRILFLFLQILRIFRCCFLNPKKHTPEVSENFPFKTFSSFWGPKTIKTTPLQYIPHTINGTGIFPYTWLMFYGFHVGKHPPLQLGPGSNRWNPGSDSIFLPPLKSSRRAMHAASWILKSSTHKFST